MGGDSSDPEWVDEQWSSSKQNTTISRLSDSDSEPPSSQLPSLSASQQPALTPLSQPQTSQLPSASQPDELSLSQLPPDSQTDDLGLSQPPPQTSQPSQPLPPRDTPSALTLTVPTRVRRDALLLELPDRTLDMATDVGRVGYVRVREAATDDAEDAGVESLEVSLKGRLYDAAIVPTNATACLVSIDGDRAKLEAIYSDVIKLVPQASTSSVSGAKRERVEAPVDLT